MSKILNEFAIINGKLIDICDLTVVSGYNEEYLCPDNNYNSKLIARKGKVNAHHFAHESAIKCNGLESALHIKAKEIFYNMEFFNVPKKHIFPYKIYKKFKTEILEIENNYPYSLYSEKLYQSLCFTLFPSDYKKFELFPDKKIYLKNYIIESEILSNGIVPDIKLTNKLNNRSLYIEIVVTSDIKSKKLSVIQNSQMTVLKINLSKYYKERNLIKNYYPVEKYLSDLFKFNNNIDSQYAKNITSINWVNIKNFDSMIINRKSRFINNFKTEIKKFYDFYFEYFEEVLIENWNVLSLVKPQTLINDLVFSGQNGNDFLTPEIVSLLIPKLKSSKKGLDIQKKSHSFKKESVEDFIKRMT